TGVEIPVLPDVKSLEVPHPEAQIRYDRRGMAIMRADVMILGAGVVGTATALQLQRRGMRVALVDRRDPGEETSFGNAGLIERSTVVPYAFPRSVRKLARYALNRRSDMRYDPI